MLEKKINLYNLLLSNDNINLSTKKYPYILNNSNNIIFTKNEIELEYIKDFKIYKEKEKNKNGSNENVLIYIYI